MGSPAGWLDGILLVQRPLRVELTGDGRLDELVPADHSMMGSKLLGLGRHHQR